MWTWIFWDRLQTVASSLCCRTLNSVANDVKKQKKTSRLIWFDVNLQTVTQSLVFAVASVFSMDGFHRSGSAFKGCRSAYKVLANIWENRKLFLSPPLNVSPTAPLRPRAVSLKTHAHKSVKFRQRFFI